MKSGIRATDIPLRSKMSGLSLVELMIALVLSATLIAGVFAIYMDSNESVRVSENLARVQESGRIAMDLLARDARMTGYQGCADPYKVELSVLANNPPPSLTSPPGDPLYLLESAVRGWDVTPLNRNSWDNGTDFQGVNAITNDVVVDSDVLYLLGARPINVQIASTMATSAATVQVTDNLGLFGAGSVFSQGDLLMIGSCENVDVFRLSADPVGNPVVLQHANTVNSSSDFQQAYDDVGVHRLYSLRGTLYFVADTGRVDEQGNQVRALYRAVNNFSAGGVPDFTVEELVEGVETLQIQYGVRSGEPSQVQYMDATAMTPADWMQVVSIKAGVLVSGHGNTRLQPDSDTYQLPGATMAPVAGGGNVLAHPADLRLRKAFISTVDLRNRKCAVLKPPLPGSNQAEWEFLDGKTGSLVDGDPCI